MPRSRRIGSRVRSGRVTRQRRLVFVELDEAYVERRFTRRRVADLAISTIALARRLCFAEFQPRQFSKMRELYLLAPTFQWLLPAHDYGVIADAYTRLADDDFAA